MTMINDKYNGGFANLQEVLDGRSKARLSDLLETLTTSQMAVLLQDGLRAIMFNSFAGVPTTWEQFCRRETSDKEQETWVELGRLGTLGKVGEGAPYGRVRPELLPQRAVRNWKYGDILEITEEMLKFDRTGLIRQLADDQGARAAQTIEEAVYTELLTAARYAHTSADNDVGNNTGTTTFSAQGLITAFTTLATMKDPRSGRYLGIRPDTLICGPSLEFAARMLLFSPSLMRVTGAATAPTQQNIYGTGQDNVFRGMVKNLIVSPYVHQLGGQWMWVLLQAGRPMIMQEVEPLQILQATARDASNEGYFQKDSFAYRVRVWFGVGFTDDRYGYFSDSTTAPAID